MFEAYINISLESTTYMTDINLTNLIILSNSLHILIKIFVKVLLKVLSKIVNRKIKF